MSDQTKQLLGAIISFLGTLEAAIGSTPFKNLDDHTKFNLRVQGNVLQATGSALAADGEANKLSLDYVGDIIQALGNSTVLVGLLIKMREEAAKEVIIKGNALQALGSFTELYDESKTFTYINVLSLLGNLLQGIGNSMQALGGIYQLKEETNEEGLWIGVYGSWIQTIGSVLSLLSQLKESTSTE